MNKKNKFCNSDITVGIPFYTGTKANELQIAIESILSQSLKPAEIHLIQDGPVSKDIKILINSYIGSYNFIKYFIIPRNNKIAYALNLSILNTSTTYYARMDSDDISHPNRLEKQFNFLEKNTEIDILGTWALEFTDDLKIEKGFVKKTPISKEEIYRFFHYRDPFIHPSVMFRVKVFAKIGLYNIYFPPAEDTELWARALKMGVNVANLPEILYHQRITGIIQRRSNFKSIIKEAKARYSYNTFSPMLNILKIVSICFRILPYQVRKWAYQNLR